MSESKSDYKIRKDKKIYCKCGKNMYLLSNYITKSNIPKFYICYSCKSVYEVGIGEVEKN